MNDPTHCHPNFGEIARLRPHVTAPEVAEFLSYYHSLHPLDRLPSFCSLNLSARPYLKRHCLVTAIEPSFAPQDLGHARLVFRIASAGEEVRRAFKFPLEGRLVSDIMEKDDPGFRYASAIAADVSKRRQIAHYRGPVRLTDKESFSVVEYCSCPFASDGRDVDYIVAAMVYQKNPDAPDGVIPSA
jgi:hypothetical protein